MREGEEERKRGEGEKREEVKRRGGKKERR